MTSAKIDHERRVEINNPSYIHSREFNRITILSKIIEKNF